MRKIILAILISIISLTSCGFARVDRGIATVRIRGVECDYRLSWEVFLDSEVSERELEDIEYEIADNISRSIRLLVNITGSSDEALDTFKEQYHNFNLYEFRIGGVYENTRKSQVTFSARKSMPQSGTRKYCHIRQPHQAVQRVVCGKIQQVSSANFQATIKRICRSPRTLGHKR